MSCRRDRLSLAIFAAAAMALVWAVRPAPAAAPAAAQQPAPPAAQPAAKGDPYAWKDLFDGKSLDNWKVAAFGGEGEVKVADGAIVMAMGNNMTGVTYTGPVPRIDYELTLEGKRITGSDFFATTTFPVGKDPCSFVTGGWGGTVIGLSTIDFYDASDNPTTKFSDFKNGRWYRFRIRVTKAKIEVWVDDDKVVDQAVPGHKIGIRDEVDLNQPLGIATYSTEGAVRNIRLRQLRPAEVAQIVQAAAEADGDAATPDKPEVAKPAAAKKAAK